MIIYGLDFFINSILAYGRPLAPMISIFLSFRTYLNNSICFSSSPLAFFDRASFFSWTIFQAFNSASSSFINHAFALIWSNAISWFRQPPMNPFIINIALKIEGLEIRQVEEKEKRKWTDVVTWAMLKSLISLMASLRGCSSPHLWLLPFSRWVGRTRRLRGLTLLLFLQSSLLLNVGPSPGGVHLCTKRDGC